MVEKLNKTLSRYNCGCEIDRAWAFRINFRADVHEDESNDIRERVQNIGDPFMRPMVFEETYDDEKTKLIVGPDPLFGAVLDHIETAQHELDEARKMMTALITHNMAKRREEK